MKKIRSIQFKVFICLFISFMVVFGYIVKTKYDQSFNELVYNTDYRYLRRGPSDRAFQMPLLYRLERRGIYVF